ncbi:MAG: hypothetical protein DRN11_03325 [Thermoplasmata archaeon]|nr:MAG: hypothetical protein DRN11_03325 [Thermoplasmata archaeon]
MYSSSQKAKTGGTIVLIFSLLSVFGAAGGLTIPKWLKLRRIYPVGYSYCPYCEAAVGKKEK